MAISQGDLFSEKHLIDNQAVFGEVQLSSDFLKAWQKRLHSHQRNFFKGEKEITAQPSLFSIEMDSEEQQIKKTVDSLNPLELAPLSMSFWRSPNNQHKGPAIYLVTDRPKGLDTPILLYIGETVAAEKRWKGDHDCKRYLAAYSEALSKTNIVCNLSIRFLTDVPTSTKTRRKLERLLIERWLPPFNKETRSRWVTPFTSEIN